MRYARDLRETAVDLALRRGAASYLDALAHRASDARDVFGSTALKKHQEREDEIMKSAFEAAGNIGKSIHGLGKLLAAFATAFAKRRGGP